MNIDQTRLEQVTQEAFDKVSGNRRWEMTIVRAKQQIETNPYLHLQADGTLLMLSDSDEIYEVSTGRCSCKAFQQGQPCKHRATRRLLLRYNETSH